MSHRGTESLSFIEVIDAIHCQFSKPWKNCIKKNDMWKVWENATHTIVDGRRPLLSCSDQKHDLQLHGDVKISLKNSINHCQFRWHFESVLLEIKHGSDSANLSGHPGSEQTKRRRVNIPRLGLCGGWWKRNFTQKWALSGAQIGSWQTRREGRVKM